MRARSVWPALGLALACPGVAQAKLAEPPATELGHVATCLRATGVPGELLTTGTWGAHGGVRLYRATPNGAVAGARLAVPFQTTCAEVATDPAGGTAVAVVGGDGRGLGVERRVLVAIRRPGAGCTEPVTLARTHEAVSKPSVAIGARGDVIVAWVEHGFTTSDLSETIRVARVPAGAAPSAPQRLQRLRFPRVVIGSGVAVGVDATGEATAAWLGQTRPGTSPLLVARAPVGRRFGAPQRIRAFGDDAGPELAVAPGGRTLVSVAGFDGATIAERPPGAASFSRVESFQIGNIQETGPVAVTDGGAAVVTYRGCCDTGATISAMVRPASGAAFSAARILGGREPDETGDLTLYESTRGVYDDSSRPHLLLRGDGSAAVAFVVSAADGRLVARLATGSAAAGLGRGHAYGSPILGAESAVPFTTDAGGIGMGWTEDFAGGADEGIPAGPGRLRVALPGAVPAPSQHAPVVAVRVAHRLTLRRDQDLPVSVRCSAACDLRVTARGRAVGRELPARRWTRIALPGSPTGFGSPIGARVPVLARASAPGSTAVSTARTATVVRRRAPRPLPVIRDLRARRSASRVVVTWRTQVPARHVRYLVFGCRTRSLATAVQGGVVAEHRGTRFRAVLGPADMYTAVSGRARWVRLVALAPDRLGGRRGPVTRIR